MATKRQMIFIACEDFNYVWDEYQLNGILLFWKDGFTIQQIAKFFRRKREEIVIALLDVLSEKEKADLFNERWGVVPRKKSKNGSLSNRLHALEG